MPQEMSLGDYKELCRSWAEYQKTWTVIQVLKCELGITPEGTCFYEGQEYPSLEAAIKEVAEDQIREWESGIKIYSKIILDFDKGRDYDEWFTESHIREMRSCLEQYPEWIANLKEGKLLVSCDKKSCQSQWVDGYHPEKLGECSCGERLLYV